MRHSTKGVHCTLVLALVSLGSIRRPVARIDAIFDIRRPFLLAGNGEGKSSSGTIIRLRPQAAMVSSNDGLAYRQAYSDPIGFRRIKRFKEPVRGLSGKADAGILYTKGYVVANVFLGSDDQLSRSIFNRAHRVGSVP